MGLEVVIHSRQVLDTDEWAGALALTPGVSGVIITKQIRCNRRARLTFVGNAVDPGAENAITFSVRVNGVPITHPLYNKFGANGLLSTATGSVGDTTSADSRMVLPVTLPEGCLFEVCAEMDAAFSLPTDITSLTAYARIRIEYEDK